MDMGLVLISCMSGIVALAAVFALIKAILNLRRVVPTNQVHIVQRANQTVSYGKGEAAGNVYYEFPSWIPYFGVTKTEFPISVFDLDLINYEAYDVGRLPFNVDVKAFFRIADSTVAAARVESFAELKSQLIGIVQGAVRSIMAKSELEDIMSERGIYGDKFTVEVRNQLKDWGVIPVKNIELMDIRDTRDSSVIQNIMAKKQSLIEMESRTEVALNKQKAETAEIMAAREVKIKSEEARQDVGIRTANAEKEIGISQQKARQLVVDEMKNTKNKEMEVKRVEQVRAAEISKDSQIVEAEARKRTLVLQAEADKESAVLKALANLELKEKEAKGIQLEGEAKADAEKKMQLASVEAQITLAEKISKDDGYQKYLISIRTIEANQAIGIEQAKNLGRAEIKVIANAGSVDSGVKSVMDLFSAKGGTAVGSALEALSNTPVGKTILDKFVPSGKENSGKNK